MSVYHLDCGYPGTGQRQLIIVQALYLDPKTVAVGNDESQVANLGDIDARVIDFIYDAVTEGEPQS